MESAKLPIQLSCSSSSGRIVDEGSQFDKLDYETIINILSMLKAPKDLVQAACVCRSWNKSIVEDKIWKKMCTELYPELGKFKIILGNEGSSWGLCSDNINQNICLQKKRSIYATFLDRLSSPPIRDSCIMEPLHASSTDNLPQESVVQTLFQSPFFEDYDIPSYWSSTGQSSSDKPETLTYRLSSEVCVVHEVKIQPFLASFQHGDPIYSARMVRFRFGYSCSPCPRWHGFVSCLLGQTKNADTAKYVWTYESPAFPMAQEETFQTFRLPKPVVCIGGIFQIEFIGRVQTQQSDGLYYICVSHVYVCGYPISDFELQSIAENGEISLKYMFKDQPLKDVQIRSPRIGWDILDTFQQLRTIELSQDDRMFLNLMLRNFFSSGMPHPNENGQG